jgi:uncharacterized protein YfdQ (DUF2303 family)
MTDINKNEASAIAALGAALSDPMSPIPPDKGSATPFVVVPEGYKVHDLERLFPVPTRPKGGTALFDADSFIRFVMENKDGATRVYYRTQPTPGFRAVFNDTTGNAAGWGDHVATYDCPLSIEWKTWIAKNGVRMSQEDFAKFMEDNALDCVTPPAADMIEIARTLEAKKKVNFASGIRLATGQTEFTYEEDIQGTAGKGRLQVPEVFTIGLPVFEGGERYAVESRLRYRIADGGKLSLWYDLVRPHKIVDAALREVLLIIEARAEVKAFNGA